MLDACKKLQKSVFFVGKPPQQCRLYDLYQMAIDGTHSSAPIYLLAKCILKMLRCIPQFFLVIRN